MKQLIEKIKALPSGVFLFMPQTPPAVSEMVAKTEDLKALVDRLETLEQTRIQYETLLMQVVNKIPGETRHDAAVRCIRSWESREGGMANALNQDDGGGDGKSENENL
jgi:hypothetical protein